MYDEDMDVSDWVENEDGSVTPASPLDDFDELVEGDNYLDGEGAEVGLEEADEELHGPQSECPACGGAPAVQLGIVGKTRHYRCRACGTVFHSSYS